MIHVLIVILLLTLFVVSAGGYMLFKTENGQQLMAQSGVGKLPERMPM